MNAAYWAYKTYPSLKDCFSNCAKKWLFASAICLFCDIKNDQSLCSIVRRFFHKVYYPNPTNILIAMNRNISR